MTSYVKVEKVYGEKENCANNVDLYNWNLDVCKNKQSRSDGEIIDVMGSNVTSRAHSSLVRGKKIMFVGMFPSFTLSMYGNMRILEIFTSYYDLCIKIR